MGLVRGVIPVNIFGFIHPHGSTVNRTGVVENQDRKSWKLKKRQGNDC